MLVRYWECVGVASGIKASSQLNVPTHCVNSARLLTTTTLIF